MDDYYNWIEELLRRLDNVVNNSEITKLATTKYKKKPAMYNRVQKCFAKCLTIPKDEEHLGAQVIDLHAIQVIQGLKPDMSILGARRTLATTSGIIAVVELKVTSLTSDLFGQLYTYLKGIQHTQVFPRILIELLSNLSANQFLTLKWSPGYRTQCLQNQCVRLVMALTFLQDVVILSPLYYPPTSMFLPCLNQLVKLMGNAIFSTVGQFRIPASINRPKFREYR